MKMSCNLKQYLMLRPDTDTKTTDMDHWNHDKPLKIRCPLRTVQNTRRSYWYTHTHKHTPHARSQNSNPMITLVQVIHKQTRILDELMTPSDHSEMGDGTVRFGEAYKQTLLITVKWLDFVKIRTTTLFFEKCQKLVQYL